MPVHVRPARPEDAPALLSLIDALADYEKLDRPAPDARERLIDDTFGPAPRIRVLLAEYDGTPAGYAITCETYSSFLALPTLYLEDIFVLPEFRSKQVGYSLFKTVVSQAVSGGYGRLEWTVLDWNELARQFYRRQGATHLKQWELWRLTRPQLIELTQTSARK